MQIFILDKHLISKRYGYNNLNEDGNFVEVPVEKSFKEHLEIQHQITIIKPNGMILKLPKPHHDDMADLMVKFCKV